MFRHTARLTAVTSLALGLAATGVLAAPAQADPVIIGIPPMVCSILYTNVVVGTEGTDGLLGTPGPDLIMGLGGDDYIYGGGGRDTILGGAGDDVMGGGPDDDCILGGTGFNQSVLWEYTVENGNDESHSVVFKYEY
jgi:Ca2+-binding RTX toxin-like protein